MKFFCTGGRGTEVFIATELQKVFGDDLIQVSVTDGKVFFQVLSSALDVYTKLLHLRSAERCMVQVIHTATEKLGKRAMLTLLHTEMGKRDVWSQYEDTAQSMKHVTCLNEQTESLADNSEKIKHCTSLPGQMEDQTVNCNSSCVEMMTTCPKQNDEVSIHSMTPGDISLDNGPTEEGKLFCQDGNCNNGSDISTQSQKPEYALSFEKLDTGSCKCGSQHTFTEKIDVKRKCYSEDKCIAKKPKTESEDGPTFRVSCKFKGRVHHKLDDKRTSMQLGYLIGRVMGWKVDLRHADIEICVHMNDNLLVVGVPISRVPLSKRSYVFDSGLRGPVAWIMSHLLNIQPGNVVLDPMCGKGTILLELSHMYKNVCCFGMDKDPGQLKVAMENIKHAGVEAKIHLTLGDTISLPLPAHSVDCVVTDAPFGQNHIPDLDLHTFYYRMLTELSRVLKPDGTMVLLTSKELMNHVVGWISCCHGDQVVRTRPYTKYRETNVTDQTQNLQNCKKSENNTCDTERFNSEECLKDGEQDDVEREPAAGCQCQACCDMLTCPLKFILKMSHYIKLGQTDGTICVLGKIE